MLHIYNTEVDKEEWEHFNDWLFDVCWSGIFTKVEITSDMLNMLECIIHDLENINEYDEELYRCPHCNKVIKYNSIYHKMEEDLYTCQKCDTDSYILDFESASYWEYVQSEYL
jgi:predicted RNA-binding Zn-ribbon protein involved in translation (DUF1610 family)